MTTQKDQDALHLFRAAVPIEQIKERYGFKTTKTTEDAIRRAMKQNSAQDQRIDPRLLEIERIDALYRAIYPQALKGNTKAVDTCLRLQDQRRRLTDDRGPTGGLVEAYESALTDVDTFVADRALVEAGRITAQQIDEVLEHGTAYERTKALYLLPHLMNVLRELGASPASRQQLGILAKSGETKRTPLQIIQENREKERGRRRA